MWLHRSLEIKAKYFSNQKLSYYVIRMAEVIVGFKVMPKDLEVNLDELEKKIREIVKPERLNRQPIAFGLVAIQIVKLIPDEGGELEKVENQLRSMEEVGEVEITGMTRSL